MGPAAAIIEKCGGHDIVASWLGVDVSRVYRWTYAKAKSGSDGYIPSQYHQPLLLKAQAEGKDLKPEDFFPAYDADKGGPHREPVANTHARPAHQSRGLRTLTGGG